jgi:formylglycine-generating enzyme required for sulfatase activity
MTCSPYADSGQYVETTYEGAELRCNDKWLSRTAALDVSNAFRGGQWDSETPVLRSYSRRYYTEGYRFTGTYLKEMGFRLVSER